MRTQRSQPARRGPKPKPPKALASPFADETFLEKIKAGEKPLSRVAAAGFLTSLGLPVKPKTLAKWGSKNNPFPGPVFYKSGRNTIYFQSDLLACAATLVTRKGGNGKIH
jgi:hypothetical protein